MPSIDRKTRDFTIAYNHYYTIVYVAVYAKVHNGCEADNLAQEIFIRFYEKYEEVTYPKKWLLGTARNVLKEHYRQKHHRELDIDEIFEDSLSATDNPQDTTVMINEALNEDDNFRDPVSRTIFDLVAVNGFSFRETSSYVGLSERQVRYRYHHTTRRIRRYLREKGITTLEDLYG